MATFLLVHGAWHGRWCWERIIPLLEAAGHRVLAPDLPGMGDDQTPLAQDVLAQWADFVAGLAQAQDERIVLVGHSRGGLVISEAAERIPDRIAGLIFVAAFLLPAGSTLMGIHKACQAEAMTSAILPAENGCALRFDPAQASTFLYQQTASEDKDDAIARLCLEPIGPSLQPLRTSAQGFGSVRRAYVETIFDQAVTLEMQREMQALLPCEAVVSLDADHSPFYSAPEALSDALGGLAIRWS